MKAILVVDMPKIDEETKNGCRNCRYADCGSIGFFESYKCVLTGQCTKVYEMNCPLKPIPKYYPSTSNPQRIEYLKQLGMTEKEQHYYELGHDDCIDEILGDTEDE